MSKRFRPTWAGWFIALLCAFVFLSWIDLVRIRHVGYVTHLTQGAGRANASGSPWRPELVVPEHNNASYRWLDRARLMFDRGIARVRHIDYENAPIGHDIWTTSPYCWWIGAIAWFDQLLTGHPIGQSLEAAALIADPLLHLLLLVATAWFVARRFGGFAAGAVAVSLAALFPFALDFLPGMPEDRSLVHLAAIWSLLLIVAGVRAAAAPEAAAGPSPRRWFIAAGVAGGIGLWLDTPKQAPLLAGVVLGGVLNWLIDFWRAKTGTTTRLALPWRAWSISGAIAVFAAYLLEFFPSHLGSWQLQAVHPLYGVAWIGAGELLTLLQAPRGAGRPLARTGVAALALAAMLAVPFAMWRTHSPGFFAADLAASYLTRMRDGASATSFLTWLLQEGFGASVRATLLPLILLAPAIWLLLRRNAPAATATSVALTLGPVLVAIGFACWQLAWWNEVDAALVALLAPVAAVAAQPAISRYVRWTLGAAGALVLLPGLWRVVPSAGVRLNQALDGPEVYTLIERDVARWLARRAPKPGAVVLAPQNLSVAFYYYGGLRGLPSFAPDNRDGLSAAVRILSASTPEEAKALVEQREIAYVAIPSWDSYLDVYARMGMGQLDGTFMNSLHLWKLPPWLQPVPYQLPAIPGFEGRTLTILQVVEDQDAAAALGRLAEYFVEMNQMDQALATAQELRRFPANLGAIVARAEVEDAAGNAPEFARAMEFVKPFLAVKADRNLPWDRRIALAVVLTRHKDARLARAQLERCYADLDEAKLRSLSTGSLYRLLALGKIFGLTIEDARLREFARGLLPDDLRARL
ncbi:MAG TPA: hypothetical protein VG710_12660 [Opitutus sp.]|nr:hypothetical protein [Opitutus sp.]